mgnify:CR=1 FL=1
MFTCRKLGKNRPLPASDDHEQLFFSKHTRGKPLPGVGQVSMHSTQGPP